MPRPFHSHPTWSRRLLGLTAVVAAAAAFAPGCAHSQPHGETNSSPVWPQPPAAPKARWSATVSGDRPGRTSTIWGKLFSFIVGDSVESRHDLLRPFGLTAFGDTLLVADPDGPAVTTMNWREGSSSEISCDRHPWEMPMAVAVDDRNIYVADGVRIVRVGRDGECSTFGERALQRPTGLVLSAGRIYAVDPPAHAVVAFSLEGRELFRFGRRGEGEGELNFPTAIAAQSDGTLLVVDTLNFRVSRFSSEGTFLGSFGEAGDEEGQFGRPKGVASDRRGNVYVTDGQWDVVLVFDREGHFQYLIGESGNGPGQFQIPAGISVAGSRAFVADSLNRRIEVFDLLDEAST
ncbi:MAG TPA: 6-bladed beta-propeller [Anaeromyxobacteraceae bacterium]|jgi:hypothetical protein|nr:6-bladed beta-propeller [Anaeromyxobacteraceae bacterium]